ncbi:NUDIX domain-containing protein [Staphylococcus americanisciuri]|uniref:NUDIX domain-containing protein n=1 Tax=Staphylococcus americanisciuri TaxID=2973940 RepID=A0ABT2F4I1_9STAP|nr:NUDIX domain-containing protein [Staphylococcus americanisciuri]MCS4487334.1 NUDIX domain-containing protein [Staphylococcus americanisciuri]
MTCILFGLGKHAQKVYWPYLSKEAQFNKIFIVDLASAQEQIDTLVADSLVPCETIFLDDSIKHYRNLPTTVRNQLRDIVISENITHAVIATEPRAHDTYIEFCLDNGINILCSKPLTIPMYTNTAVGASLIKENFQTLVKKWQASDVDLFEILPLKHTHTVYQYVRTLLEKVVETYQVPINKINLSASYDYWQTPNNTLLQETQPYKYGYGALMHEGYHLIELLTFFTAINKKHGFQEAYKTYHVSDYRPSDYFKYYGKALNKHADNVDNNEIYQHLNIIENFGEFELATVIDYVDDTKQKITTANIQLKQASNTQQPMTNTKKDAYQEHLEISIGPFITVKINSYTTDCMTEPYFDIVIFRNTTLLDGKAVERLQLSDIEPPFTSSLHTLDYHQAVSIEAFDNFFFHNQSHSNILDHQEEIEILTALYQQMAQNLDMSHFRFAVELIIEHNNKFLVCRRRPDVEVAPGLWNVPAGKVQYNESMDAAIIREAKEETNLDITDFSCLGYQFINKAHQRCVYTYHVKIDDISNIQIDTGEFDQYAWIDASNVSEYSSLNPHIQAAIVQLSHTKS